MIIQIVEIIVLAIIAIEDVRSMNISSWKIWVLAALSALSVVLGISSGICEINYLIGALLPGIMLIGLYYVSGKQIGLGDGMVILGIGPAFGLERIILGVTVAFFLSGLFSIVIIVALRNKRKKCYPFIPFIAAGMVVATVAKI